MGTLRPVVAPPVSLPADVRAALCGLAEEAGHAFVVLDSQGRTVFRTSTSSARTIRSAGPLLPRPALVLRDGMSMGAGRSAPLSAPLSGGLSVPGNGLVGNGLVGNGLVGNGLVGNGPLASGTAVSASGSATAIASAAGVTGSGEAGAAGSTAFPPEQSLPLLLPGGESGSIGILLENTPWSGVEDAWLRSAARIAGSTLKMASEADNMAGEIARAYEELSLLYSSSSRLSASEDLATACAEALGLAMHHIQARSAAIYLRHPSSSRFLIAASDGDPLVWAPEVRPDPCALHASPLFLGQCILWEEGSGSQMESVGIMTASPGSVICTPLQMEMTLASGIMGWLVFYGRRADGPFTSNDAKVVQAVASQAAVSVANARLVEERQALLMGTIRSLAAAVDARDRYTHGHSVRVTDYTLAIARQLRCSEIQIQALELAGLLHDVGKIGVPDRVLTKPGKLDEEEWSQMRRHPLIGAGIVGKVPGLDPIVQQGVRSHHERVDGRGYPDGLTGDQIPFAGRILSVADCFDAMTSDRPYRRGMSDETAIQQMIIEDGRQFEPAILAAFIEVWVSGQLRLALAS